MIISKIVYYNANVLMMLLQVSGVFALFGYNGIAIIWNDPFLCIVGESSVW